MCGCTDSINLWGFCQGTASVLLISTGSMTTCAQKGQSVRVCKNHMCQCVCCTHSLCFPPAHSCLLLWSLCFPGGGYLQRSAAPESGFHPGSRSPAWLPGEQIWGESELVRASPVKVGAYQTGNNWLPNEVYFTLPVLLASDQFRSVS